MIKKRAKLNPSASTIMYIGLEYIRLRRPRKYVLKALNCTVNISDALKFLIVLFADTFYVRNFMYFLVKVSKRFYLFYIYPFSLTGQDRFAVKFPDANISFSNEFYSHIPFHTNQF